MRSKYIRFFISSTFADMAKERNILQRSFAKISAEYAEKEWQIEAVDLRWGISQEAGYDNKTMQICKAKLSVANNCHHGLTLSCSLVIDTDGRHRQKQYHMKWGSR